MPIPHIPVRDKEDMKAEADEKWRGDSEKVATTSLTQLVHRGTHLSSRYNKAHEYKVMAKIVNFMLPYHVSLVESVFCDSKACATYSVQLAQTDNQTARIIAEVFQYGCLAFDGGHNGIFVHVDGGEDVTIDPMWVEYFEDHD